MFEMMDEVLLTEGAPGGSYFMYQIFCGVKAMHDVGIIHRDLVCPQYCVLDNNVWLCFCFVNCLRAGFFLGGGRFHDDHQ